eukprot:TRINITY_DN29944_c0_g1_i1.p1 TRINITY_DN29944_c0_g1~~TRINITY_DN29944_c0_g1_i1.p1  ORF type:complete len:711 (+),score=231.94 TRINITY_DN29944_c0_g1_i1:296-2428(+)
MASKKPLNVQAAKVKLNEFFIQYLTQPDTQDMMLKLEKMGGGVTPLTKVGSAGSEILLGLDGVSLDSPMIQLDRVNSDGASSQGGLHGLSFNSPPRSPRASPSGSSHSGGRALPTLGSPMVDELDVAHRQGAMSPHGSPRASRQSLLESATPTSPLHTSVAPPAAVQLHANHGSQNLNASVNSNASDASGAGSSSVRLSTAFAQMDQNSLCVSSDGHIHSPHTTPTSPSLRPLDRDASGSLSGSLTRRKKQLTGEPLQNIPTFYFSNGKPLAKEESDKQLGAAKRLFEGRKAAAAKTQQKGVRRASTADAKDKGLNIKAFGDVTQKVCLLPRWMNELLFRRVYCYDETLPNHDKEKEKQLTIHPTNTLVTYAKFKEFYDNEMANQSKERRLFDFLKWDKIRNWIVKADLRPVVEEVLIVHPGLEFLKSTPDFQERYADTVQIRIMYSSALQDDTRIMWSDFCRSTLCDVLHVLDVESDINVSNKTEYFSYEHFYVLYCKFWELDGDHDFYISKDDLAKYGSYSLTNEIVDRVFTGKGRGLTSDVPGKMNYEDFVWFCLCEEDKTTLRSLDYWFQCTDVDGDGILSGYELDVFFKEQKARMEAAYPETIAYEDILCQMMDMISPAHKDGLRLSDIRHCRLSGNFFNALFNLTKFIAFEQRDPFMAHAEKQWPEKTDWDRFAKVEYDRMAHEAGEQDDVSEEFATPGGLYGC